MAYVLLFATSCAKFVDVGTPQNGVSGKFVFASSSNATAAMLGIYSRIMQSSTALSGGSGGINFCTALCSDELKNYSSSSVLMELYANSITQENGAVLARWTDLYKIIYDANVVIEGVQSSPAVADKLKDQLTGEAKFFRAYCYFFLANLYSSVPLLLSSDYAENSVAKKAERNVILSQVIADLKEAFLLLDEAYVSGDNKPTQERARVNKWAVAALLSRVYLYNEDWENAESFASQVIENKSLYDTVSLSQVFAKNSREAILQFQPVVAGLNTFDAQSFVLTAAPSSTATTQNTTLTDTLVNSFQPGDLRKEQWIGSKVVGSTAYYYANKYKEYLSGRPLNEYFMVLRLGEQYLIRAEARIKQDRIDDGISDVNIVRRRARAVPSVAVPDPLPDFPAGMTKNAALMAVEVERWHELFTESSHRWFDLIRTGRVDVVLGAEKGGNWQPTDRYWPIPLSEIGLNANLNPQNPGY